LLAAFECPPLQSDFPERLVAAEGALNKCGLLRFRPKTAAALNACGVKSARRSKRDLGKEKSISDDIHDLVGNFEKSIQRRFLKPPPGQALRDLIAKESEPVTIKWIRTYRDACEFEQRSAIATHRPER